MNSELLLKFIGYFPDYLSVLSRTLFSLFFFFDSFCRSIFDFRDTTLGGRYHQTYMNLKKDKKWESMGN